MEYGLERRDLSSYDGTRLAYFIGGPEDAPPLVISNGLGGNLASWRHVVRYFSRWYRICVWDYRGLYGSDQPADPRTFSVAGHARDLFHLIEQESLVDPILMGWSMGVQVQLELHREHPELARAMICCHGTHGHPLATGFQSPRTEQVAPMVFQAVHKHWRRVVRPMQLLARQQAVQDLLFQAWMPFGLVDKALDRSIFNDMAKEWVKLNLSTYALIFEELGHHTARDLLPSIKTPTLVVAGAKDRFTPLTCSEEMVAELSDAELFVVPNGTHFGVIEYPQMVNIAIERFLDRRLAVAA